MDLDVPYGAAGAQACQLLDAAGGTAPTSSNVRSCCVVPPISRATSSMRYGREALGLRIGEPGVITRQAEHGEVGTVVLGVTVGILVDVDGLWWEASWWAHARKLIGCSSVW